MLFLPTTLNVLPHFLRPPCPGRSHLLCRSKLCCRFCDFLVQQSLIYHRVVVLIWESNYDPFFLLMLRNASDPSYWVQSWQPFGTSLGWKCIREKPDLGRSAPKWIPCRLTQLFTTACRHDLQSVSENAKWRCLHKWQKFARYFPSHMSQRSIGRSEKLSTISSLSFTLSSIFSLLCTGLTW